jgi:DNA ligase-associated metallophosphoesterase
MRKSENKAVQAIRLAGRDMLLDRTGVVLDVASRTLVVADLHLEKAEAFARRGQMLPPYDSIATLQQLARAVSEHGPERIVLLGDSFHRADSTLPPDQAGHALLRAIAARAELIWIAGNHDPAAGVGLPGQSLDIFRLGAVTLRHEPSSDAGPEMFGHFHPVARIATRAGTRRRRCFVQSEARLLLPAFGALTGGLDISEPAIATLFPAERSRVYLAASESIHAVPMAALVR